MLRLFLFRRRQSERVGARLAAHWRSSLPSSSHDAVDLSWMCKLGASPELVTISCSHRRKPCPHNTEEVGCLKGSTTGATKACRRQLALEVISSLAMAICFGANYHRWLTSLYRSPVLPYKDTGWAYWGLGIRSRPSFDATNRRCCLGVRRFSIYFTHPATVCVSLQRPPPRYLADCQRISFRLPFFLFFLFVAECHLRAR